jgi:hypothetical protein
MATVWLTGVLNVLLFNVIALSITTICSACLLQRYCNAARHPLLTGRQSSQSKQNKSGEMNSSVECEEFPNASLAILHPSLVLGFISCRQAEVPGREKLFVGAVASYYSSLNQAVQIVSTAIFIPLKTDC